MKTYPAYKHWSDFFSDMLFRQAREVSRYVTVTDLQLLDSGCSCNLLEGDRRWTVSAGDLNQEEPVFHCTCSVGKEGKKCRHMVVMMLRWAAAGGEKKIRPLVRNTDGKGRELFPENEPAEQFFKVSSMMKNRKLPQKDIAAAQAAVANGRVKLTHLSIQPGTSVGYGRDTRGQAVTVYESKTGETISAYASFSRNQLIEIECSRCDRYSYSFYYRRDHSQTCEHCIALLMVLDEYLRRYNPGDATDREGMRFLRAVRSRGVEREDEGEKQGVIRLVPRIIVDRGRLQLQFQIGKEKLYIAKNLQDIVQACQNAQSYELGKNNSLNFAEEDFVQEAKPYYRLIERAVLQAQAERERLMESMSYHDLPEEVKSRILLYGTVLDDFFELAKGGQLHFKNRDLDKGRKDFAVEEGSLTLSLTISPFRESGRDSGVELKASLPPLTRGGEYRYQISEEGLFRIPKANMQALEPFYANAAFSDSFRSRIGHRNLPDFYYRALPLLQENQWLTIIEEETERIRALLPGEVQLRFYIDLSEKEGRILCRAEALYGDNSFPLMDTRQFPTPYDPRRDLALEHEVVEKLLWIFPDFDEKTGFFLMSLSEDTLYGLLEKGLPALMELGEVHVSDAFDKLKLKTHVAVTVGVSVESNLLDLTILSEDISPKELMELLESYRKKKRYHRLRDGSFFSLEADESLGTLSDLLEQSGAGIKELTAGRLHLPLYRALYVSSLLEQHEEMVGDRDKSFRSLIQRFQTIRESDYEIPAGLKGKLRSYQIYGYRWLRTLSEAGFGGILADDMGLGKTLQMMAVLQAEKEERAKDPKDSQPKPSLIVCPASLVYNWKEEFERFAPDLRVQTVTGGVGERKKRLAAYQEQDVLVTSYDLLKRDVGLYEGLSFRYMVLDEAQYIKNQKASVAKTVKVIQSEGRFALTGTPIENRLAELWSIFDFLMPGFLYNYEQFRSRFEIPVVKNHDAAASARLQKMVAPFILRRKKGDVLKDLPDKLEELRYALFEEEQQRLYDAQLLKMQGMLQSSGEGRDRIRILAEITKLREICCDPSLLFENYDGSSAKRAICLDTVLSAVDEGHHLLLFSQFTSMLELLEADLKKEGIPCFKLTGSTPKEERIRLVHAFNRHEVPVFLISLKAGGTGLNLVGADMVIHYDPWWNLAAQNQATDRAHRIGQTKEVSVIRLVATGTIEEKILDLQASKQELAEAVLAGEGMNLKELSWEDLKELIG